MPDAKIILFPGAARRRLTPANDDQRGAATYVENYTWSLEMQILHQADGGDDSPELLHVDAIRRICGLETRRKNCG
jgi:hypothetical protein